MIYSLQTALMYAAAVGSEQVMLTLLKAGAARAVIDAQVGLIHQSVATTVHTVTTAKAL
jgi:hypothetical protein